MYNRIQNSAQDIALRDIVINSSSESRFPWHQRLSTIPAPSITIVHGDSEHTLNIGGIADLVGATITDICLLEGVDLDDQIFSESNQAYAESIAKEAVERLAASSQGNAIRVTYDDIYHTVSNILIAQDRFELAKALMFRQSYEQGREDDTENQASIRLIRRNGNVVPWRAGKIKNAIERAFLAMSKEPSGVEAIAEAVEKKVIENGENFINIEDVQDLVQRELMIQGHFDIAEHYILYRSERSRLRASMDEQRGAEAQADNNDPQQESMILVTDADGSEFWDGFELKKRIRFASIGLNLLVSEDEIEQELRRSIPSEVSREDLKKTIILNAKSLMERDSEFAKFAGRILLSYIYEEVLDWSIVNDGIELLKEAHQKGFKKYIERGIEIDRLSAELNDYDIDKIAGFLDPTADLDFDYLGVQTIYDRYLIIDKTGDRPVRLETPQFFWVRVAMGLFKNEPTDKEEWVQKLYKLYKGRRFCSSTPTLFNSGTLHSQLSSCYLYTIDDSIESIMQRGIADNAYLSKWAGGLGGSWTSVRGLGSYIKGTNGESQGVIPFLKLHNDQLVAVNQGGKRRGSGCAYLETWHNDIYDFLELRIGVGDERRRTHDMNTANWIPDLFMQRMETRQEWTLFRANETPDLHELYGAAFKVRYEEYEAKAAKGEIWSKKVPALDLWKKMLSMIFETGHPWITFKDPCNVRSPQDHAGVVHSSNLCTEITLNTSEDETAVCNLGSVVLENHVDENGEIDHKKLQDTIQVAIRALDNVIDINFYPTPPAENSNTKHRPIGMGVMGLQNALFKRDISFASNEAVEFNDEIMEAVAYYAYSASSDLAAERGTYSSYEGSKWSRGLLPPDTVDLLEKERGQEVKVKRGGKMDWTPLREKIAKQGMRNSNVLAIAPTATISNIMGTTPCIEPNYKNLYVKENLSGKFIVLNRELVKDLKALNLWDQQMINDLKYYDGELDEIPRIPADLKFKHKTVFGVGFEYIVDAAARRQKWIDQAQSVNLFLAEPNMKMLSHMYRRAWDTGMKTTYYLRTLGANSIEKATVDMKKETRGVIGGTKKEYTPEEVKACSLEAMMNGEECEACQ